MLSRSIAVALALVTAAVTAGLAAGAGTTSPGGTSWTRVTDPDTAGDQLGLARAADGTLHVIWNRGKQPPAAILDTRFSANGARRGTTTVVGRWDAAKTGLALLVMPDKTLRLFTPGNYKSPATSTTGIATFTAPASGAGWAQQPDAWGGPIASSSAVIGATLTKDGQAVTGWRGFAAEGIPPSSIPPNAYAAFQLETHLATDASSGAVVLAGVYGGGKGGVWVQQILPAAEKAVVLSNGGYNNDFVEGLTARIGAPGVFVAYADTKSARLYRYGGGSRTLARGPYKSATTCAGPDGRLWVAWGDSNNELFVTRTNRAAGTVEPVRKLTLPQGSTAGLRFLQCEGSAGPLDLFAQVVDRANRTAFWHTHVFPQLTVQARSSRGKTTLTVRDAGDPVAGAAVVAGGRRAQTTAQGQATLSLGTGSHSVTVSAPGYAAAAVKVTVR